MEISDPLIEAIFEFLLKQVWRQSLPVSRTVYQRLQRLIRRPIRVEKTQMINREREIRAIRTAMYETAFPQVICLVGPAGVGKTRILEEVAAIVQDEGQEQPVIFGGIIDFYHNDLHNLTTLWAAIIANLDLSGDYFQNYKRARTQFELHRSEGRGSSHLQQARNELGQIFLKDYEIYAADFKPILTFDTTEQLSYESDLIQRLCKLESSPIAAREWLFQNVSNFSNSLLIFAGRETSGWSSALIELSGGLVGQVEIINVTPLLRDEGRQLLELYLEQNPDIPGTEPLRDNFNQLWDLVGSSPVYLAVIVELLIHSGIEGLVPKGSNIESDMWGQRLINSLFDYEDENKRILFLLAIARKGLTIKLLHYLIPSWTLDECQERLNSLINLSVIKIRPKSDELFLHDALYELFDTYGPTVEELKDWFKRLAEYFKKINISEFRDSSRLEEIRSSQLYYELQINPNQAFEETYIRWSEMAIKGFEVGFDMELRDELLRFFSSTRNQQYALDFGLTINVVHRDSAIRWIKRYLILAEYPKAITVAETILAFHPDPSVAQALGNMLETIKMSSSHLNKAKELFTIPDPFFWGHLLAYYGEALAYTSSYSEQVPMVFERAIHYLNESTSGNESNWNWFSRRIKGRALTQKGYQKRVVGNYSAAQEAYLEALNFLDESDLTDERANTFNNLAFVLALLGDFDRAILFVQNGLELYSRLQQRYSTAISYNTRGIIRALNGNTIEGQDDCLWALNILKELEAPRGIGLACNALGFVLRLHGQNKALQSEKFDEILDVYKEADKYLSESIDIFNNLVKEPVRLWEAYNERGSLHYEWGLTSSRINQTIESQQKFQNANLFHSEALKIARAHGLNLQEADTRDDHFKVSFALGKMEEADSRLTMAENIVPKSFSRITNKTNWQQMPERGYAYWMMLGKIKLHRGTWHLSQSISENDGNDSDNHKNEGLHCLTQSVIFFSRYWSSTKYLSKLLYEIVECLDSFEVPRNIAAEQMRRIASFYNFNLDEFISLVEE